MVPRHGGGGGGGWHKASARRGGGGYVLVHLLSKSVVTTNLSPKRFEIVEVFASTQPCASAALADVLMMDACQCNSRPLCACVLLLPLGVPRAPRRQGFTLSHSQGGFGGAGPLNLGNRWRPRFGRPSSEMHRQPSSGRLWRQEHGTQSAPAYRRITPLPLTGLPPPHLWFSRAGGLGSRKSPFFPTKAAPLGGCMAHRAKAWRGMRTCHRSKGAAADLLLH